jgi:hypothetical protein
VRQLFRDLVDIGTLHQAQTNVRMPQAVRPARLAFSAEAKLFLVEDGFKKLALLTWEKLDRQVLAYAIVR